MLEFLSFKNKYGLLTNSCTPEISHVNSKRNSSESFRAILISTSSKPVSSGVNIIIPLPMVPSPLAVLPTRCTYSIGSFGGSYWRIQSTAGKSRPLEATSVQSKIPFSARQNWKNRAVLFSCFNFP